MSLDFAVLGDREEPVSSCPLGVEQHWRLFGNLSPTDWPLLARLHDYYEDAHFSTHELENLAAELERRAKEASFEDVAGLQEMLRVTRMAQQLERSIDVQAD